MTLSPNIAPAATTPATFIQSQTWFLEQVAGEASVYVTPRLIRVRGALNVTALHRAVQTVVEQAEALRATFHVADSGVVRRVHERLDPAFEVTDFSYLAAESAQQAGLGWAEDAIAAPFDLAAGPLLRVGVCRLRDDDHLLLVLTHAAVVEDAGMPALLEAIGVAYNGDDADPDRLSAATQTPAPSDAALNYWADILAQPVAVLDLPIDAQPGPAQTFSGRAVVQTLPLPSAAADAHAAALAAFQTVLLRYTGATEFLIGSHVPVTPAETGLRIGALSSPLPLRADLSGEPGFATATVRAATSLEQARRHAALPLAKAAELAGSANSKSPLFRVMFAYESAQDRSLRLGAAQAETVWPDHVPAVCDLLLRVVVSAESVTLVAEANRDLFAATTIERFLGHVATVWQAGVAQPDTPITHLPLLTDGERDLMLGAWNETPWPLDAAESPQPAGVHRLVESFAGQLADKTAVIGPMRSLTYAQLNQQANALASQLQAAGVGVGDVVAVSLPRSADSEVALLAALKAGAVYLPIDPEYPTERLRFMLHDSNAALLITRGTLEVIWPDHAATVIDLDEGPHLQADSVPNPGVSLSGDDPAYLIYTSGSTGRPKGVVVTHDNITQRVRSMIACHELTADDRQLQFVSHSFDMAVEEMLEALCCGGSVAIHDGQLQSGPDFADTCAALGVTKLNLPSSYWSQLVAELVSAERQLPSTVRLIVAGGEAMSLTALRQWHKVVGHEMRLLNGYGPTEATIISTAFETPYTDPAALDALRAVPIGLPLAATTAHVLDGNGQLVPIGVPGELCLGGPCVALGYLNRQNLTAEKFIPDPFAPDGDGRLYRTGDLVRREPDGNLTFIGRIDTQVKIRGYRIETGEIEHTLRDHPSVTEAVVIPVADGDGPERLIAYLVVDGNRPNTTSLREFAAEHLPSYMIPAGFMFLDELPLTPNGKVDRRALPLPGDERPDLETAFAAPQSAVETWLAAMWRDVLGVSQIGIDDDFFELGGDSIRGAILINRLQEELGEYVYVVALFDAPTIAQLAAFLRKHYPQPLADKFGVAGEHTVDAGAKPITEVEVTAFRALIPPRQPLPAQFEPTNPRAIFIFSPPRSGSTLMRVVLGGSPALFAPPELYLLSFDYLGERQSEFGHRYRFWREGAVRALMNLKQCDADSAEAIMTRCEDDNMSVQAFYAMLQSLIPQGQTLVDKTPAYALNADTLRRAEALFSEVHYVHLLRHPYGMIRSFEDAKTGQLFFRPKHDFTQRQLAELIWQVSHQNILDFLAEIPPDRQHRIRFEDMVRDPLPTVQALCDSLGIEMHPGMLAPQDDVAGKMTDGIHPLSKMMGDVKFHQHSGFNPKSADRWREQYEDDFLGDPTWRLAESFGYERIRPKPATSARTRRQPPPAFASGASLVPIKPDGNQPALFCVHPINGTVMDFVKLGRYLDADQPLYGLQSQGLNGDRPPLTSVAEMADHYLSEIRALQPHGPYFLGGRCMGGMIVLEMAQRLLADGEDVGPLLLFDARAPFVFMERRKAELRRQKRQQLRGVRARLRQAAKDVRFQGQAWTQQMQDQYKQWAINRRMRDATAQEQGYHRVSVANLQARAEYVPGRYDGSGVIYVPTLTPEGKSRSQLSRMGWYEVFGQGLEMVPVDADHTTILAEPAVEQVAAHLRAVLAQVEG